jgi:hypothetical protein
MPSPDLDRHWLAALQRVTDRAAHEVRDSLNGVALNLEVVRSRSERGGDAAGLFPFATAAAEQQESLTERIEAVLFLARPPRPGTAADVAMILRQLGRLLVPAAKADGGRLTVTGLDRPVLTAATPVAARLALATGLLAISAGKGAASCTLEAGAGAVVRFSHESADTCELDPAIASLIAAHDIEIQRPDRGGELLMIFPGA